MLVLILSVLSGTRDQGPLGFWDSVYQWSGVTTLHSRRSVEDGGYGWAYQPPSEVEREKGSRIAEPIFPSSAENLPVVATGEGPKRRTVTQCGFDHSANKHSNDDNDGVEGFDVGSLYGPEIGTGL